MQSFQSFDQLRVGEGNRHLVGYLACLLQVVGRHLGWIFMPIDEGRKRSFVNEDRQNQEGSQASGAQGSNELGNLIGRDDKIFRVDLELLLFGSGKLRVEDRLSCSRRCSLEASPAGMYNWANLPWSR